MEKGDKFPGGTLEGLLVDEAAPGVPRLRKLAPDVIGGKGNVMNSAVRIFFQKFRNRTLGRGWFEKFDVRLADTEKCRADFLVGDFLHVPALQAERFFVVGNCIIEGMHRDTKVVYALQHASVVAQNRKGCKDKLS